MPRNGYYEVSGYLELRRRRRGGGSGIVDAQVVAGVDDGYCRDTGGNTFFTDNTSIAIGAHSGGVDKYTGFARWLNVTIPQGATIDVAYITVSSFNSDADGSGTKTNLYFEDSDDAVAPTDCIEIEADVRTTAFTAWDDIDFTVDLDTDSPSIVNVVKEIVDRGSWVSGNAMMLLWDDDSSTTGKLYNMNGYDIIAAKAPKLHVEWSI